MTSRKSASVFTFAVLVPLRVAFAQPAQVTGAVNWAEVIAGTNTPVASPNGLLEPGECALIGLSFSFTPPVGTPVTYHLPQPGGVAPVAGFADAVFSLIATGAQGGTWSHLAITPGFAGGFGIPLSNGTLDVARVFQPVPPLGAFPIATNPLPGVWQAVWNPSSYDPRLVGFLLWQLFDGDPLLFVHTGQNGGNPTFGYARAIDNFGQVQIPVAPAPDAGALVFCLGIAGARRRRRGSF